MSKLSLKVLIPQIRPISWILIVLTLITFLSVINSNVPKINKIINLKKTIKLTKKTIKW